MWRIPLQNRIPLLKPVKFFSHSRPERFRVGICLSPELIEFGGLYVCLFCKRRWWREEPFFLKDRFDVRSDGRHGALCTTVDCQMPMPALHCRLPIPAFPISNCQL